MFAEVGGYPEKKSNSLYTKTQASENTDFQRWHIFHLWVYLVFPRKELIKVDFKSKPCFSQQVKFKHQPQPLSLYLREKKSDHLLFYPLVLQSPLEIR